MSDGTANPVDLVLGGGGVRGVAHVGALSVLEERGWSVRRLAGASSGAMAGAVIAAGASPAEMREGLAQLDWRAFAASDLIARLSEAPIVGGLVTRLQADRGIDPLEWITGHLESRGVNTWGDLRLDTPGRWLPDHEQYRLVVRCLDVVNQRVVRLPWDYRRYGLDPNEQSVALAVRASMAIPLVFTPVPIGDPDDGGGLLIDGGLGSGFAVDVLDRRDGRPPEHPTFALRLLDRQRETKWPHSDLAFLRSVVQTMVVTGNDMRPVGPCDESRTVAMDTSGVRTLDVRITEAEEQHLYDVGREAMTGFLDGWDSTRWLCDCRPAPRN